MITASNFYEVVSKIDMDELLDVMDRPGDFISLDVVIFNGGYTVLIDSLHYSYEAEREAHETGNLFCDKDEFERMLIEHGINLDDYVEHEIYGL